MFATRESHHLQVEEKQRRTVLESQSEALRTGASVRLVRAANRRQFQLGFIGATRAFDGIKAPGRDTRRAMIEKKFPDDAVAKLDKLKRDKGPGFLHLKGVGPVAPWNDHPDRHKPVTSDNVHDHALSKGTYYDIDFISIAVLEYLDAHHQARDGDQRWYEDLVWDSYSKKSAHDAGGDLTLYPSQQDAHLNLPGETNQDAMARYVLYYCLRNYTSEPIHLVSVQEICKRLKNEHPKAFDCLTGASFRKEDGWITDQFRPKSVREGQAVIKNVGTELAPDYRMAFDENAIQVPENASAELRCAVAQLVKIIDEVSQSSFEININQRDMLVVDNTKFLVFRRELPYAKTDWRFYRRPDFWFAEKTRWLRKYRGYKNVERED